MIIVMMELDSRIGCSKDTDELHPSVAYDRLSILTPAELMAQGRIIGYKKFGSWKIL